MLSPADKGTPCVEGWCVLKWPDCARLQWPLGLDGHAPSPRPALVTSAGGIVDGLLVSRKGLKRWCWWCITQLPVWQEHLWPCTVYRVVATIIAVFKLHCTLLCDVKLHARLISCLRMTRKLRMRSFESLPCIKLTAHSTHCMYTGAVVLQRPTQVWGGAELAAGCG
jgi:hypothetical protein